MIKCKIYQLNCEKTYFRKNFNKKINRRLTDSVKWKQQKYSDSLPFWVADSDYPTAKCIMKDLKN